MRVDNKLKQGESLTLEFKERIYFVHNNENNSRDVIINASSLKIARLVCGFLNSTIYENAYIIFGVSDNAEIIDKDDSGVKADLTFFEKDFKNKTEKDFKIIDRIIQNLREKLCFLLEKQNVASYINFHEKLYRKQIRLVIIEIKKSNQPIFIKYNSKIFSRASEHKQEPKRKPEIFNEEEYTNGLFVRSSRDIDYLKGNDLYEFFKINFGNTGVDEDY